MTKKQALRTKDIANARELRDELVRIMDEQASKLLVAKGTLEIRNQYLNTLDPDEKEYIEDHVREKADDLAYSLGVYEQLHDHTPTEELNPDAVKVQDFYNESLGQLHVLEKWLPEWLPSIQRDTTRRAYGRGVRVLMKHYPVAEDLNWEKVSKFYKTIGSLENVHKTSIEKWRSGYISLWKFLDLDAGIWRRHEIPETTTKEKPPAKEEWTKEEVRMLYETAIERNHWLKNTIWIAVHTGARQSAIANLIYNRDKKTIIFPRAKKEIKNRTIPAHPDILTHLDAWVQNSKSASSISNRFTEFKHSLGYGIEKDFHSFRRTLITEFENLECPENICADIIGHKKGTITYGLYSGGTGLEVMRKWIEKVRF